MLLSAVALLDEEPSPTEADVMHHLRRPALHRLPEDRGRHPRLLGERPVSPAGPLRVVGRSVRRPDAVDKVTGRARYVTDLRPGPGMLAPRSCGRRTRTRGSGRST